MLQCLKREPGFYRYLWGLTGPIALVLGSEAEGVSPEILAAADQKVKILMAGHAESLNVAVAGGIVMFEAARAFSS